MHRYWGRRSTLPSASKCPQLPQILTTHRNTQQDTEKLEECYSLPCFPCPLHPPVLLWICCSSVVAVSLEGATECVCNSRLIALRKQVRSHKREDRSGVTYLKLYQQLDNNQGGVPVKQNSSRAAGWPKSSQPSLLKQPGKCTSLGTKLAH